MLPHLPPQGEARGSDAHHRGLAAISPPSRTCLAHGLVVIMSGLDRDVTDLVFMAQESEPLAGEGDALGGFADAELEGVAGRIDDQKGAGGDHGQEVAGRGVGRAAGIDLADAASGR